MKPVLFLVAAVALSSCTTLANRRDMYRISKPDGPATKKIEKTSGVIGPTI